MIKTDLSGVMPFVSKADIENITEAKLAHQRLLSGEGIGAGYTGWIHLPETYDREEFSRIKDTAQQIISDSDVLIVIGIGGSYLGARAIIELLKTAEYNNISKDTPDIYYAGINLSGYYLDHIVDIIKDRDFSINYISKSGSTMEPGIAFRVIRKLLVDKYGEEEAARRTYVTTSPSGSSLMDYAVKKGFKTFSIPSDIGGRYSVFSAVGLLPVAVAGIDLDRLMAGARYEMNQLRNADDNNPAFLYANARRLLYKQGKKIELLSSFDPSFRYLGEWWRQLFAESEGKNHSGIFPSTTAFTTDLHSMGQYVQDGERIITETIVSFGGAPSVLTIPKDEDNFDNLNYLSGMNIEDINKLAIPATKAAHIDGGVPVIEIRADGRSEYDLGALLYFFELSCGISGYMAGIMPFDQPGVEAYKRNIAALLGKPSL
jgi:glucose-6-phosphate isomerase